MICTCIPLVVSFHSPLSSDVVSNSPSTLQFYHLLYIYPVLRRFCCPQSHVLCTKSFKLVWWCHQLLSRFLANGHLPPVSHLSANNMVIMRWYQGLCTDLLAFTLWVKKTCQETVDDGYTMSLPQIGSAGQHSKGEGRREGKDGFYSSILKYLLPQPFYLSQKSYICSL